MYVVQRHQVRSCTQAFPPALLLYRNMELSLATRFFCGLFALSVVCNICQFISSNYPGYRGDPIVRRALTKTSPKPADSIHIPPGARKVFIDLGANDGSSTTFFLKKEAGADNIAIQGGEKDSFLHGLGASGDWEVIVMEANTNFSAPLNNIRAKALANKQVKDFTVYAGTAIAKTSGDVSFIIDNPFSGSAGATLMKDSTSAVGPKFRIPAIGIADLFQKHSIQHSDFVILKMDIEGYEFELLRHVLTHGVHSRIDVLAVEFHDVNYWVFGKTDEIRVKYQALHSCLDWMAEDIHGLKMVKWGR
jgi:FkbM family methyltransferase